MIKRGLLNKLFILMVIFSFTFLISCTDTTNDSQNNSSNEDEEINYILENYNIFKEVSLEDSVIDRIKSHTDDTVYLDENLYVYKDEDPFSPDYHVFYENNTYSYNMYTTGGPYQFAGFDHNNFEYLYLRSRSIVSTNNDTVFTNSKGNITQLRDFQVYGSYIIDYYGENIKNSCGTVIYPKQNDLYNLNFYSYTYKSKADQKGFVINSFDGLDSQPTETIIHDEYVVDGYTTINNTYVFELTHRNNHDIMGFAIINPETNSINKVLFEDYHDFDDSNDNAIDVINNKFIYFYYFDSNDVKHYYLYNPSNNILLDYDYFYDNRIYHSDVLYFDDTYILYLDESDTSTEAVLIKNGSLYTSFTLINDEPEWSSFILHKSLNVTIKDNYLYLTQNTTNSLKNGGITAVSLTNAQVNQTEYSYFYSYDVYNDYYLMFESSNTSIEEATTNFYYLTDNSILSTDIEELCYRLSPTQFYYIDNNKLLFYDLTVDIPLEFNLIGEISCSESYLVEYNNHYFILKTK